MTKTSREQVYRDTAASIPAGRAGEAGDIAHAYLYCLTQPFATGSTCPEQHGATGPDIGRGKQLKIATDQSGIAAAQLAVEQLAMPT